MSLFLQIVFWVATLCLFHSYIFYPLLLKVLAKHKSLNSIQYTDEDEWPRVSVIMSVYNEEAVIEDKLKSLLDTHYPSTAYDIYIGSDCSSDRTNTILAKYADQFQHIHFFPFDQRQGKPGVVNSLVEIINKKHPTDPQHIYIFTDASVLLAGQTVRYLVRHFANENIFLVDANMRNTGLTKTGIAQSESQYVAAEVQLKYREGVVWGKMIGPFGGCYALRSNYYHPVPPTYLVDDFYITMKAFEQGGQAISDLEAICYEAVPQDIKEEYRRKSRISAGNFQNLATFGHLLLHPSRPLGFAFLSHKVLRWLGPFFIIFALISSGLLAWQGNLLYGLLLCLQLIILMLIPLLDNILKRKNVHLQGLRNISYFIAMNMALLEGFFKYLKGIKTNVWQPPKRQ